MRIHSLLLMQWSVRGVLLLASSAALLLACSDGQVSKYDGAVAPDSGQVDKGSTTPDTGPVKPDKGKDAKKPLPDKKPPLPDKKPPLPDKKPPLPDLQPPKPDASPPGPFTCASDCAEYAVDRYILPLTSSDAQKYALTFAGKKYNALGSMLALLASQAPGMELQEAVHNDICAGQTINLLRVKAKSLVNQTAVKGQAWIAKPFTCCTMKVCLDTKTKNQCEAGSKLKCFGGTGKFQVDKTKPGNLFLAGAIKGGALNVSGGKLVIRLSLSGGGGLDVPLKMANIRGNIIKGQIHGGILTGGVAATDVKNVITPALGQILNKIYTTTKDKTTKDMLKQLFDTNKDGKIDGTEVYNNALLKTFLAGDVDLDGDKQNEVSFGIGFTAVQAAINTN